MILALASLLAAGNAFGQPAEFTLVPAVAGPERVTEATGILEAAHYFKDVVGTSDTAYALRSASGWPGWSAAPPP